MPERAYALREDAKETFSDAAIAVPNGKAISVGKRLKDGGGVIVTDDPREQRALDRVAVLKSVSLDEADRLAQKSGEKSLTNDEIRAQLDELGIDHSSAKVKADLQALLDEANATAGESGEEDK